MSALEKAAEAISQADALLIGASNGLSIAEGYHLFADNAMFRRQFGDFQARYGIRNVLEGCLFPYPDEVSRREFLQRLVRLWVREYRPSQVMEDLRRLVAGKEYFLLTTNADTHLERAGFDPERVFELEGTFEQLLAGVPIEDKSRQLFDFLARCRGKRLVVLELGVGRRNRMIRPVLERAAAEEPQSTYIALNLESELCPPVAGTPFIGLGGDLALTLHALNEAMHPPGADTPHVRL